MKMENETGKITLKLPLTLLNEFDDTIKAAMYHHRSAALREAMRDLIVKLKKRARR